jgi:hypothetical protein
VAEGTGLLNRRPEEGPWVRIPFFPEKRKRKKREDGKCVRKWSQCQRSKWIHGISSL